MALDTASASTAKDRMRKVDFVEAGAGPLVVLVHSSMAGAHQWSALTRVLEDRFLVRAVNLYGYGATPSWSEAKPPSLDNFAELVALAVPDTANTVRLVGHSLGGAVAMQLAAHQLEGRVTSLVLIEPSLFYLLDCCDRHEAFDEVSTLAHYTRRCISDEVPEAAAERFIDYWCGAGVWKASSPERKAAFVQSVTLLRHEWGTVLEGELTPAEMTAALPRNTLVISSAKTVRPSRELVGVLLNARPDWGFASIPDGGHMAPLTHPQLVNPMISDFLARPPELSR
jgi:pimeloyl-ACP methyl ester carboxylesterase